MMLNFRKLSVVSYVRVKYYMCIAKHFSRSRLILALIIMILTSKTYHTILVCSFLTTSAAKTKTLRPMYSQLPSTSQRLSSFGTIIHQRDKQPTCSCHRYHHSTTRIRYSSKSSDMGYCYHFCNDFRMKNRF